jgi:CheY-like chemotaxis protein
MSQPSAVELFRQAMATSRAGDKPRTRDCLREAVRLDPTSETSWQWLAAVLDDPAEATAAWERVLALNPSNEKARASIRPVRLLAGVAAAKAKDMPTARRLLRAVVADEPRNEHGWLWLAGVCESPTEAKAHLERVLSINPASAAARKGIAYYDGKIEKMHVTEARTSGALPRPADPARPAPPPEPAGPRRVLVVDGSRTHRKLVGMAIDSEGFTLAEAEDVDEAIDRIRDDGVPDLVVLDARAAGLPATDFCRLLREHPETAGVPVLVFTSGDPVAARRKARFAGATDTLTKPLDPEHLLGLVRRHARPTPVA